MKFRNLVNLSLSIALSVTTIVTSVAIIKKESDKKTEHTKTQRYEPRPNLIVEIDTIHLNKENFSTAFPKAISGCFFPTQNKVKVFYFNATDDNDQVNRTCEHINGMIQLTMRHELEHAQKAHLTKITPLYYSAHTRARIAAINETMAPAAEIIEALDYHYTNRTPIPTCKVFVQNACDSILKITDEQTPTKPINFNDQRIADIVIENALKRFKDETARGQYTTTLRRRYNDTNPSTYTPHNECDPMLTAFFSPEFGVWAPLWQYKTVGGPANLWLAASEKTRQKLMDAIDSIIYKNTGKTQYFAQMQKSR